MKNIGIYTPGSRNVLSNHYKLYSGNDVHITKVRFPVNECEVAIFEGHLKSLVLSLWPQHINKVFSTGTWLVYGASWILGEGLCNGFQIALLVWILQYLVTTELPLSCNLSGNFGANVLCVYYICTFRQRVKVISLTTSLVSVKYGLLFTSYFFSSALSSPF